jgi:hypothetical protein
LLERECCGEYPGGTPRALERREILCRHIRPVALAAIKNGLRREAWQFYCRTLLWHLRFHRWRFLVGFPVIAAAMAFHSRREVADQRGLSLCEKS